MPAGQVAEEMSRKPVKQFVYGLPHFAVACRDRIW
jgi:hypothetical protein